MGFQFITNLRDQTVSSFERRGYAPPAWLLSSHRISKARLELARSFRESGALIFADNGTKKLIEDTANRFSASQEPLRDWIRQMRYDLPGAKRIPSPSEVPELLREQVSAAAHQVCDDVDRVLDAIGYESVLVEQLEMTPTHLVAREDYAVACLISLGLEREISGWPVSYFDRRNQKTLDFWRQIAADPRCDQIKVFATLSAVDYSTARSAARLAAKTGVDHVALGYAGINSDSTYVDSFIMGYRRYLPQNAPRRYVRGTAIALGLRDGFRDVGRTLKSFHGLGLGTLAQYPVLAAAFDSHTDITVDATSPLHDAVNDLVFYDEKNWGDRVDVIEATERILAGEDEILVSPFTLHLAEQFGQYPQQAREWWQNGYFSKVTRELLYPQAPLGSRLGVFASAPDGSTAEQARGRTAHNHWVCDLLSGQVPAENRRDWGLAQIEALIQKRKYSTRSGLIGALTILEAAGP